jgi:hypothetical protein
VPHSIALFAIEWEFRGFDQLQLLNFWPGASLDEPYRLWSGGTSDEVIAIEDSGE